MSMGNGFKLLTSSPKVCVSHLLIKPGSTSDITTLECHGHNDIKKRSTFSLRHYVYVIMFLLCYLVHTSHKHCKVVFCICMTWLLCRYVTSVNQA